MSPELDQALVAGVIFAALGYLCARLVKRRRKAKGCGGDCGCAPAAPIYRPKIDEH
ncbi:MAG TPA: FeoB-associated Cys-rich membrane protein [Chthoniobacteraceae bacterium]|jgi:hypothetical protein|nr:hypothetical protein [Chthoniobacter sp.]HEV7867695.1 FeoB-associated Cys-rich membrane protein [Chthoniobacteraceae bacterium]